MGSHDQLMSLDGVYSSLVARQMAGKEEGGQGGQGLAKGEALVIITTYLASYLFLCGWF